MEKNIGSKEAGVFLNIYRLYAKLYGNVSWDENDIISLKDYLSKLSPMVQNGDIIVDAMLRGLNDDATQTIALQHVSEDVLKLEQLAYKTVSTDSQHIVAPEPIVPQKPETPISEPIKDDFTSEEKQKIDESLEDAKEGRISPLEPEPKPIDSWQGTYPKHQILAKYQSVHIYSPIVDAIMDTDDVPDEFTRKSVAIFLVRFYKDVLCKELSEGSSKVYAGDYIKYLLENKRITAKDGHFIKQYFRTALSTQVDKSNWTFDEENFLRENFFKLEKSLSTIQTFLPNRTEKQIHDKAVFMGMILK